MVVRLGNNYLALPAAGVRGVLTNKEAGHEQAVTAMGTTYPSIDLVAITNFTKKPNHRNAMTYF